MYEPNFRKVFYTVINAHVPSMEHFSFLLLLLLLRLRRLLNEYVKIMPYGDGNIHRSIYQEQTLYNRTEHFPVFRPQNSSTDKVLNLRNVDGPI